MDANSRNTSEPPKSVIVKEQITRKILRSVMSQFSSVTEALLELVDNAFDEFDGVRGGNHLDVDIVLTKNSISIENTGGKGMGVEELRKWLTWGEAHKVDAIGEYGQGGKAAMGYLGSSWKVRTKRWDESYVWEIEEKCWDDVASAEKTYKAIPRKCEELQGIGYCCFEIRKLKRHRQNINRIRTQMSNIYRHYLKEGKASISVNHEPVKPMEIPLYEGFRIQQFKEKSSLGFPIRGWVGRLKRDARVRGEIRIVGGMRLLRKGRLICDGEYFGHHDYRYRASLGMLIGEVDLPRVAVLPNKTDFHRDSPEWEATQNVVFDVLQPHIHDLLSQKEEETVTREERRRVQNVRDMMIEALRLLSKYEELSSRFGEDKGRKPPEIKQREPEVSEREILQEQESSAKQKKPRTPPPLGAVGRLKRLGRMPEWELRVLEPSIRSVWGERETKKCLLINKKYCLYEEREGDELYIAETAILQLARPEGDERLSLQEYLGEIDLLMRAFCEICSSS